jgi:hypothetical protein
MRAGWMTAVSLSVMLASGGLAAQWLNFKTPRVPRRPDGTETRLAAARHSMANGAGASHPVTQDF